MMLTKFYCYRLSIKFNEKIQIEKDIMQQTEMVS